MATLVGSATKTLIDLNDAITLSKMIMASRGTSQVFADNDGALTYTPSWAASPYLVLTAYVYAGNNNVASTLTNRKWSKDTPDGASLGSGTSLTLSTNLLTEAAPTATYYFQGDWTDPNTRQVTHVLESVTLTLTKKGDAAVFVDVEGDRVIVKSDDATPGTCRVRAGLYRNDGNRDVTNVSYKWFKIVAGAEVALVSGFSNGGDVIANYAFKDDAGAAVSTPSDFSAASQLVISEKSVAEKALYKVTVKDTRTGNTYAKTFDVYDKADPYDPKIEITGGTVFKNGEGTKTAKPVVTKGARVIDVSSWTFRWYIVRDDAQFPIGGFVDTSKTPTPKTISANTASAFTVPALAAAPAAGSLIKVISSDGSLVRVYEVGVGSTTTSVVIRVTGLTNTGVCTVAPTASQFVGGDLYCLVKVKETTGYQTVTITSDDVDGNGDLGYEAYKPI